MAAVAPGPRGSINLGALDDGPLRGLQIRAIMLCAMLTLLDGFDNQVMGVVAPLLSKDLGLDKAQMGLIFSLTQVGATIGALLFGPIGDRFGRRPAAMISVCIITLFTWATTIAPAFGMLLIIRFATGIGLAGVFSPVLALTSEYAPLRLRGTLVALVYAGYNMGAGLGGLTAAALLEHYDWRVVLYVGMGLGLTALTLIIVFLPESLRFLIAKRADPRRIDRLLDGLGLERAAIPDSVPGTQEEQAEARVSLLSVFRNGLAVFTVLLCLMNAFVSATSKVMVTWLPTILEGDGFTVSQAAVVQSGFAMGGIFPMLLTGWLIDRIGPFRVVVPGMILTAACLAGLALAGSSFLYTFIAATLVGAFVAVGAAGGQVMGARLFPVVMRSTGLGVGTAAARFGSIISPSIVAYFLHNGAESSHIFLGLAVSPLFAALMAAAFAAAGTNRRDRSGVGGKSPAFVSE